ncbi:MAG: hypothetical protein ACJA1F_003401 [Paracoccaceae bacterium]|jgi:hypothetical protein
MALITNATTVWSDPVTLAEDEIWQARQGSVFLTTTDGPVATDGIALALRDGLRLTAGTELRYRKEGSTAAVIVREVI